MKLDEIVATVTQLAATADRVIDVVAPQVAKHPREPRVGDDVLYHLAVGVTCPAVVLGVPGGGKSVELAVTTRRNAVALECVVMFRSAPLEPGVSPGHWEWKP